ncbi:MAG: alpha/beta hydrolase [Alistipes sp.]
MKKLFLIISLLAVVTASAQNYGQDTTLCVWTNATAPHSNALTDEAAQTTLYFFRADKALATGQAVVICPGGGYQGLAIGHEGYELAQWFARNGIAAAVLKYRMPNGHKEVPLEDAVEALRTLRKNAQAWGFDAAKVGIVGSSAGGHLAASASTLSPTGEQPAFAILFYPVITGERGKCHEGSFDHLLGTDRTAEQTAYYSLENRVTTATPPTFILFSDDDTVVPTLSGTRYYNALKAHGIKSSLHIFPSGGHGWGIRDDFKYKAQWQPLVLDWMSVIENAN